MGKKLYVGNLTYQVTDGDLTKMFEPHGSVRSAQVIMDRDTGRSKGFGFVEMGTDQEAAGRHPGTQWQGGRGSGTDRQRSAAQDRGWRPRRRRRSGRLRRRRRRGGWSRRLRRRGRRRPALLIHHQGNRTGLSSLRGACFPGTPGNTPGSAETDTMEARRGAASYLASDNITVQPTQRKELGVRQYLEVCWRFQHILLGVLAAPFRLLVWLMSLA